MVGNTEVHIVSVVDLRYSAGWFTGISMYHDVLNTPVQRFHHNGTGYDRIPPDIK